MAGIKVFQNAQAFFKVGNDGRFDDFPRRFRHQAPHTRQLLNLRRGSPRPRMGHHENGIHLTVGVEFGHTLHHHIGQFVRGLGPDVDDFVVFFPVGDQTIHVLLFELQHFGFGFVDQGAFFRRNDHVIFSKGNAGSGRMFIAQGHHLITENHRIFLTTVTINDINQVGDIFFRQNAVHQFQRDVFVPWQDVVNQQTAWGDVHNLFVMVPMTIHQIRAIANFGVHGDDPCGQGVFDLCHGGKGAVLPWGAVLKQAEVINPQNNVLTGNNDGLAVGGAEDVVGAHHQNAGFQLCL